MLIQNTEKLNVIKVKHSIVPHLIHQLDAEILSKVVKSCKEHEIKLSTVHDCFVVNRLDQEKVKTFYFQAFLEAVFNIEDLESETLSLEKHPILHLFLRNFGDKITDQDVLTQLILKYRKKQYEIYRNIKNGTLIKNTHILKE
jgi:DNA-directed RNA polymerase